MYWHRASDRQLQAMEAFCIGKQLLDLGGYNGSLSCRLIEAGAASAINVDKENPLMAAHHRRLYTASQIFAHACYAPICYTCLIWNGKNHKTELHDDVSSR